jgi:hypothetical protein
MAISLGLKFSRMTPLDGLAFLISAMTAALFFESCVSIAFTKPLG